VASEDDILRQAQEHFRKMRFETSGPEELTPEDLEARRSRELNEKEVQVRGVFQAPPPNGGAFVLLRDSLDRNLPIWIGEDQAVSISIAAEGAAAPRPMTHDLMKLLVERLGGSVDYILIDDLYNNVYYAKLVMRQGDKPLEIDCRPSDAIAVGLRFRAPIYVADHVLEEGQCELSEE
jgi:uncharacterized protein